MLHHALVPKSGPAAPTGTFQPSLATVRLRLMIGKQHAVTCHCWNRPIRVGDTFTVGYRHGRAPRLPISLLVTAICRQGEWLYELPVGETASLVLVGAQSGQLEPDDLLISYGTFEDGDASAGTPVEVGAAAPLDPHECPTTAIRG